MTVKVITLVPLSPSEIETSLIETEPASGVPLVVQPIAAMLVISVEVSLFICPGGLKARKASALSAQSPMSPPASVFQLSRLVVPPSVEK